MCLPKQVKGSTIQSVATALGNLLCLNFGVLFGITPAHMALYESEMGTPLNKVTDPSGTALLTGYLFLSAAFGAGFSGCLALRIGPKSVLLCCGLLQIFSWFCIHFGFDIVHIHASRMFGGVAAGGAFVVLPIFINEITESRAIAARLTFSIEIWRTLGILMGFVMGFYLDYNSVNVAGCIMSCVFSLCFPFVQESPHYYARNGYVAGLEKSLRWYRGIRDIDDREKPEYLHELAEFKKGLKDQAKVIAPAPLNRRYITRLICLSFLLTICAKLSGAFIVLNYAADFLGRSGNSIAVNYVLLASAQCIGAFLALQVGPRMPRKLLLSLSSLLAAVSVVTLALYRLYGHDWSLGDWCENYLSVILLAAQLLFVSFGLYPLAAVICSEMLPAKLHDLLYSVSSAIAWLLVFGLIEGFNIVKTRTTSGSLYLWIFAAACIFVGLLSLVLLPETRNRRVSLVQRDLGFIGQLHLGGVAQLSNINNGHTISHI